MTLKKDRKIVVKQPKKLKLAERQLKENEKAESITKQLYENKFAELNTEKLNLSHTLKQTSKYQSKICCD